MGNFFDGNRIVVTGGAGFIGLHTVDALIKNNAEVYVLDNLSKGSFENIIEIFKSNNLPVNFKSKELIEADKHRFIFCELEQKEALKKIFLEIEPDIVIHLAANIGGRGYIDTKNADMCSNFSINHNVFSCAFDTDVERVHYSSTACVYPVSLQNSYNSTYLLKEEDAFNGGWAAADGEYGWAKLMGEVELRAYNKNYGLKGSVARYVTVFGPLENDTHAIIALIKKAIDVKDPYIVWGSGNQDRDFTHVRDIVNGSLLITEKITDASAINLGTSKRYKIREVVDFILRITNHNPKSIIFDGSKPEGVKSRALDITKAKQLGWKPEFSLESALSDVIKWYADKRPMAIETIE